VTSSPSPSALSSKTGFRAITARDSSEDSADDGHHPEAGVRFHAIDMKILLEDKETGLMTTLFRWQPGAELALHERVEIEQIFVLEGSLVAEEGELRAGNYV
jgi:quercetin dioxygenase-like cupin family protein